MKLLFVCLALVAVAAANTSKNVRIIKVDRKMPMPHNLNVLKHMAFPKSVLSDIANKMTGKDARQLVAQVNEYADILLKDIDQYIISMGMDPMQIPDIYQHFEYQPIIITYHGELNMTNGWLFDVATLHRGGDANLKYEYGLLNLQIPLSFNDLIFDYDYHADIMDIGPTGKVEGSVVDVQIFIDIVLDFYNMEIVLQDFRIEHAGSINVNFTGNDLIDWLIELLVEVAASVLHDTVIGMVEGGVYTGVEGIIADMNTMLQNVFNPPA